MYNGQTEGMQEKTHSFWFLRCWCFNANSSKKHRVWFHLEGLSSPLLPKSHLVKAINILYWKSKIVQSPIRI